MRFSEGMAIAFFTQKIRKVSYIVTFLKFCGINKVQIVQAVLKFTVDEITQNGFSTVANHTNLIFYHGH